MRVGWIFRRPSLLSGPLRGGVSVRPGTKSEGRRMRSTLEQELEKRQSAMNSFVQSTHIIFVVRHAEDRRCCTREVRKKPTSGAFSLLSPCTGALVIRPLCVGMKLFYSLVSQDAARDMDVGNKGAWQAVSIAAFPFPVNHIT